MGIEWYVLVDGDEVGKKYVVMVCSLLNNDWEVEWEYLMVLLVLDMEYFMYCQGFFDVFYCMV